MEHNPALCHFVISIVNMASLSYLLMIGFIIVPFGWMLEIFISSYFALPLLLGLTVKPKRTLAIVLVVVFLISNLMGAIILPAGDWLDASFKGAASDSEAAICTKTIRLCLGAVIGSIFFGGGIMARRLVNAKKGLGVSVDG